MMKRHGFASVLFVMTVLIVGFVKPVESYTRPSFDSHRTRGEVVLAAESADKQTAAISVTDAGFVPLNLKVKKGVPVDLVITRKTDQTCAKAISIPDYGIKQELPLNEPVTVTFTPARAGDIKYTCGLDMMTGVISVE